MTQESNYYSGNGSLANVQGKYVTVVQFNQLVAAVQALQSSVGSSESGIAKDVADLKSAVEDLQTVVGDASSGLVKRVSDLENA